MEKEKEKLNKFSEEYRQKLCNHLPERVNKNLKDHRDKKLI